MAQEKKTKKNNKDGSRNISASSIILMCVFACTSAYNWDRDPVEKLVGKNLPATFYETSKPINRTFTAQELEACEVLLGRWKDSTWEHPPFDNYNLTEVLINLGGSPGEVKVTKNLEVPNVVFIDTVSTERPLPDPPRRNWIYEYNSTDYASYVRLEHASKQLANTPKEFLDIRGKIAWTPSDFCGQMRLAFYRLDDTGLHFEIRPNALVFQDDASVLAIRNAPIRVIGLDGKEKFIS